MKKILSFVLAASLLLSTLSLFSCQKDSGAIKMNDKYTIVVGKDVYLNASPAASTLSDALKNEGITTDIKNDVDAQKGDFEILLGLTDRAESKQAYEKLESIDDYIVDPISENVIVICGKTPRATEKAVEYFLNEYVRAGTGEFKKELFVQVQSAYKQEYEYESLKFKDITLGEYIITVKDDSYYPTAYRLAYMLGEYSGEFSKVIPAEELTGDEKAVICVGTNGRNPKKSYPSRLKGYFLNYENDDGKITLTFVYSNEKYLEDAFAAFSERFVMTKGENTVESKFTPVTSSVYESKDPVNNAEWIVKSKIERPIADGVMQTSYTCEGYEKLPYLVHVMTVDPSKADLMLGTANNRSDVLDEWVHTPLQHAQAAQKAGYTVLGATNGGGSVGISIKDGKVLEAASPSNFRRGYFGMTKEGKPIIGASDKMAKVDELQMAASATYILVDNYMPCELYVDSEVSYTTHPRTLIGIRGDGTVVMVVIDGRQPALSNGAPFERCADIMMKLGCKQAVNLDGGGSSTMLVRNSKGNLDVVNKISDPSMRQVRNSILVVAKSKK